MATTGGKPTDLVVSYTIDSLGAVRGMTVELNEALAKGYRVIKVVATPFANAPAACVTVVLSTEGESTPLRA